MVSELWENLPPSFTESQTLQTQGPLTLDFVYLSLSRSYFMASLCLWVPISVAHSEKRSLVCFLIAYFKRGVSTYPRLASNIQPSCISCLSAEMLGLTGVLQSSLGQ